MTLLKQALDYHNMGLCVLPCKPKDKAPGTEKSRVNWKQYQVNRPDEKQLEEWFKGNDNLNIGILCGAVSKNHVALDFDSDCDSLGIPIPGKTGIDKFKKFFPGWEDLLTKTWVAQTPKEGIHVHFQLDKPVPSKVKNGATGIELRSEGCFLVMPPSVGANGKDYKFISSTPNLTELEADVFVKQFNDRMSKLGFVEVEGDKGDTKWDDPHVKQPLSATTRALVGAGVASGSRNSTRFSIFSEAKRKNWSNDEILELLLKFNDNCRPKEAKDVVLTHYNQMIGQEFTPPMKGMPAGDIEKLVVDRGRDKNYYIFHLNNNTTITIDEENLITPKQFIVGYLRTHNKLVTIKLDAWKNYINWQLRPNCPTTEYRERDDYNEDVEVYDLIIEFISRMKIVNKREKWAQNTLYYEDDKIYVMNSKLRNILDNNKKKTTWEQLRIILSPMLIGRTTRVACGSARIRAWAFSKQKLFGDNELIFEEEEEEEASGDGSN